jgi:hypothetical protein
LLAALKDCVRAMQLQAASAARHNAAGEHIWEPGGTMLSNALAAIAEAEALAAAPGPGPEIRNALRLALSFAEDEAENREDAGGEMSDYINQAQEVADTVRAALKAAEKLT